MEEVDGGAEKQQTNIPSTPSPPTRLLTPHAHTKAWHLSGDFYSKRAGNKPWISEMYGYAFGAASLGIRHAWDEESMVYPGYAPVGVPRLLHYGLLWHVDRADGTRWSFDKHW